MFLGATGVLHTSTKYGRIILWYVMLCRIYLPFVVDNFVMIAQ